MKEYEITFKIIRKSCGCYGLDTTRKDGSRINHYPLSGFGLVGQITKILNDTEFIVGKDKK